MNKEQRDIIRSTILQYKRVPHKCEVPYLLDCARAGRVYIPENINTASEIVARMNRAMRGI